MNILSKFVLLLVGSANSLITQADPIVGQAVHNISSRELFSWLAGLILVLGVFFLGIWLLRRTGRFAPLHAVAKMRILSVLALGMREKVVLISVGKKQLVLAVTPGRIETLAVLEDDACVSERSQEMLDEQNFAHKLMQVVQGKSGV